MKPGQPETQPPSTVEIQPTSLAPVSVAVGDAVSKRLRMMLVAVGTTATLSDRLRWFEEACRWLVRTSPLPIRYDGPAPDPRYVRCYFLLDFLTERPDVAAHVSTLVRSIFKETSGLSLFAETGLPGEHGFVSDFIDRIADRILPHAPEEKELSEVFQLVLKSEDNALWIEQMPPELFKRFGELIEQSAPVSEFVWAPVYDALTDAVNLLAANICSLGVAEEVRERTPEISFKQSPFLLLNRRCDELVRELRQGVDATERVFMGTKCRDALDDCRWAVKVVLGHLDQFGVSINLVYRLEKISHNLDRLEMILAIVAPARDQIQTHEHVIRLLAELVRGSQRDRSVRYLVQSNLRQLARKIVERAGDTGQHYITRSRDEYFHMLRSAAGGGFLTTGTTVLKYLVGWTKLPLFFEFAFNAMNYAGSFVVMQALGFTLATKQPSMTAAALAGRLHKQQGEAGFVEFAYEVSQITRSQMAAILGNIGLVIPTCTVFHYVFKTITGNPFLDAKTATYVVSSLNPLTSFTIGYAALTGVLLWFASVCAGWIENWAVYRKMPEALMKHRALNKILGADRTRALASVFSHNIGGVGGNVSLGMLLAATPIVGKFFGAPLDVRHVTLSTGGLVLAGLSLGPDVMSTPTFLWSCLGIVIIGCLNFGVSFALALLVALRAREINTKGVWALFKAVFRSMRRVPSLFFMPPPRQ